MVRDGIYYALGFTAAGVLISWLCSAPWPALPHVHARRILRLVFSRSRAPHPGGRGRCVAGRWQSRLQS